MQPGIIKRVQESKMAFKCMENINSFLEAAKTFGVPSQELFQTVDLWERQNLNSVVICLQALGRKVMLYYTSKSPDNRRKIYAILLSRFNNTAGFQIWSTLHWTEGSREERAPILRGTVEGWRHCHLPSVRIEQRSQPEWPQFRQHSTHVTTSTYSVVKIFSTLWYATSRRRYKQLEKNAMPQRTKTKTIKTGETKIRESKLKSSITVIKKTEMK